MDHLLDFRITLKLILRRVNIGPGVGFEMAELG